MQWWQLSVDLSVSREKGTKIASEVPRAWTLPKILAPVYSLGLHGASRNGVGVMKLRLSATC